MNHTEKTIPVWEKYSLNVSEAAEYYGIGEKRLRQIAGENEGADFILEVGSHIRFKRKLFEDYSWQDIYDYCKMRLDNGAAVVRFKFVSQEAFSEACQELLDDGVVQNVAQYYMKLHGLGQVEYHYGVMDNFYTIYFIF